MSFAIRSTLAAAWAAGSLIASPAAADPTPTPLSPGESVTGIPDFPSGVVHLTEQEFNFSSPDGPAGVLTEVVSTPYLGAPATGTYTTDPYGPDGLVFAYKISLTSDTVAQVVIPGFGSYATSVKICDVGVCFLGTGTEPTGASRSANGDVVTYDFSDPVLSSSGFDIYTNARSYTDPGQLEIIDPNGAMSIVSGFLAPAGGVPEPGVWVLMLAGVGLLGVKARRKLRGVAGAV